MSEPVNNKEDVKPKAVESVAEVPNDEVDESVYKGVSRISGLVPVKVIKETTQIKDSRKIQAIKRRGNIRSRRYVFSIQSLSRVEEY